MNRHSLRLRLLLISALTIAIALTLAGAALTSLFARHVETTSIRSLTDDLNAMAALVDAEPATPDLTQAMPDPRFVLPYGGIYWQVTDPVTGAASRSRSVWDGVLATSDLSASTSAPVVLHIVDPEGSPAIAVGRRLGFELADGRVRLLDLVVAEDNDATEAAIANYRIDLAKALAVLGIALVAAAWAQVTLGLSPLRAIRTGVNAIRTGKAKTLEGTYPSEVLPLVAEVNDLTNAQEVAIQFARERAADLAHGLRSQLQVLNAEAHQLRLKGDETAATGIETLTAQMTETIEHQLGLARLRRRSPHQAGGTLVAPAVAKVLQTLQRTPRGATMVWTVEVEPDVAVSIDGSDLLELLGTLMENATKWASRRIRIGATASDNGYAIIVEDDGPGLPDDQLAKLGTRGLRLDESRSGSGIGLSIAREISALNSGSLTFARSALGGLEARVELPKGNSA